MMVMMVMMLPPKVEGDLLRTTTAIGEENHMTKSAESARLMFLPPLAVLGSYRNRPGLGGDGAKWPMEACSYQREKPAEPLNADLLCPFLAMPLDRMQSSSVSLFFPDVSDSLLGLPHSATPCQD